MFTLFYYQKEICMTVIAFLLIIVRKQLMKWLSYDNLLKINSTTKHHNWILIETLSRSCRCSKCSILIIAGEGYMCSNCGLSSDHSCLSILEQEVDCKRFILQSSAGPMLHHWVKGGSILVEPGFDYVCNHCGDDCHYEECPEVQCCWCQRLVHSVCKDNVPKDCDFGAFRRFIVPPSSVILTKATRISRDLVLKEVIHPGWDDWSPVIIVANRQAGNSDGSLILTYFRRILNPCQVIDLASYSPETIVHWCTLLEKATVLVGGGDGTISWVLNTIHDANMQLEPSVGIIPLGTGNDLSRALGWGNEYERTVSPSIYLQLLDLCNNVHLDRWQFNSKPSNRRQRLRHPRAYKSLNFYNYFSIGVDAKVALDFHQTRQSSSLYICKNRFFNKMLYLCFGTQQAMDPDCKGLQTNLELFLDGQRLELPEIESIVILNIPSWAAGVDLWRMGEDNIPAQALDDGKFEVVAIYSSFHIAQLQMGLSVPYRIGQGSHIKIKLNKRMAVQADGEPWIQQPGEIVIKYNNSAKVLKQST